MGEDLAIQKILDDLESDVDLIQCFGEDKPISSRFLNTMGTLFEERGIGLVRAFVKANCGDLQNTACFEKLWGYIERINALEVPNYIKGFMVKKLEALAEVKLGRRQ